MVAICKMIFTKLATGMYKTLESLMEELKLKEKDQHRKAEDKNVTRNDIKKAIPRPHLPPMM